MTAAEDIPVHLSLCISQEGQCHAVVTNNPYVSVDKDITNLLPIHIPCPVVGRDDTSLWLLRAP